MDVALQDSVTAEDALAIRRARPGGVTAGGTLLPIGDAFVPLLFALLIYTAVVYRRRTKETLQ